MLASGNKNRTQHPTDANAESSRSHAVFQVTVIMFTKDIFEIRLSRYLLGFQDFCLLLFAFLGEAFLKALQMKELCLCP